jgi:DNA-binding MarR family transcriptional regulator
MEFADLDALERLAGLLRIDQRRYATAAGLQMVHHDILDYLGRSNRYSNSPRALTEFLGLTKGTVSQSLKLLESKGYIIRTPDAKDRRAQHLELTDIGREYVWESDSNTRALFEGITVSPAYGRIFSTILKDVLWQIQMKQGRKGYAQCSGCRHHTPQSDGTILCGLTHEHLSADDAQKICREHEFAN